MKTSRWKRSVESDHPQDWGYFCPAMLDAGRVGGGWVCGNGGRNGGKEIAVIGEMTVRWKSRAMPICSVVQRWMRSKGEWAQLLLTVKRGSCRSRGSLDLTELQQVFSINHFEPLCFLSDHICNSSFLNIHGVFCTCMKISLVRTSFKFWEIQHTVHTMYHRSVAYLSSIRWQPRSITSISIVLCGRVWREEEEVFIVLTLLTISTLLTFESQRLNLRSVNLLKYEVYSILR